MPTIIKKKLFIFKCISEPVHSEKSFLTYELSDGWVEENMELSFKQLEPILLINFCQAPWNIFHDQIPSCLEQHELATFYQSSLGHSDTSLLKLNKSQTLINKDWHDCKSNEFVRYLRDHKRAVVTINGFNFKRRGSCMKVPEKSILAFLLLFNYNWCTWERCQQCTF